MGESMELTLDILYGKVLELAPWILGIPILPGANRGKYIRIAADHIFQCSHVVDGDAWCAELAQTFTQFPALLSGFIEKSGCLATLQAGPLALLSKHVRANILFAFCQSQMAFEQYNTFVSCLFFDKGIIDQEFGILSPLVQSLFPSSKDLKNEFRLVFERFIGPKDIQTIYLPNEQKPFGHQWKLNSILDFIMTTPTLQNLVVNPHDLTLIHRADAFPCGGQSCFLAAVTLANFGPQANCVLFNFIQNMAYSNDKNFDDIVTAWGSNLQTIQKIQNEQQVRLECIRMEVPCRNKFSFDESFARKFLGLNSSSGLFCCFKCYYMRNRDIFANNLPRVTEFISPETFEKQVGGHVRPPMIFGLNPSLDMGHCITHGLMAFGRILVKKIYSFAVNRDKGNSTQTVTQAHAILEVILGKGKINLLQPPEKGTWNIKGCQAARLLTHFVAVTQGLQMPSETTLAAENLYKILRTLYTSDYDPQKPTEDWIFLFSKIESVISQFELLMQHGSEGNYPHIFAAHTTEFIKENRSLRLYSNTVLETLNSVVKQNFLNRSSRKDFLFEAFQRQCMRLFSAVGDKNKLNYALQLSNQKKESQVVFQ